MVVKDRMASAQVSQIVLMLPEAARPALGRVDVQPTGSHARRPALDSDRKRVVDSATKALEAGAISPKACEYLKHWATGERRRQPRPLQYQFLMHRPSPLPAASSIPNFSTGPPGAPRPVRVASVGDHGALPVERELDDEVEAGPLSISQNLLG